MVRPSRNLIPIEPADARSLTGLADVLEPDCHPLEYDPDYEADDNAITSLRQVSVRMSAPQPPPAPPVQDFAFADTVFARELEDEPPPPSSARIFHHDPRCVTPLAFPLPPELPHLQHEGDLATRLRFAIRRATDEMRELWAGTAEIVEVDGPGPYGPPPSPFAIFVRRALALWSCFQWSRADLTRAAMIGGAVFVIAATLGAATIGFGSGESEDDASSEVRAARTLDQHTGKKIVIHSKR